MRTNSKQVKAAMQQHIIECMEITCEYEGLDELPERLDATVNDFKRVMGYRFTYPRSENIQQVFIGYLQGLPVDSFLFATYDALEFMESIGLRQPDHKSDCESFDLYCYIWYSNFVTLCKKNNIDFMERMLS